MISGQYCKGMPAAFVEVHWRNQVPVGDTGETWDRLLRRQEHMCPSRTVHQDELPLRDRFCELPLMLTTASGSVSGPPAATPAGMATPRELTVSSTSPSPSCAGSGSRSVTVLGGTCSWIARICSQRSHISLNVGRANSAFVQSRMRSWTRSLLSGSRDSPSSWGTGGSLPSTISLRRASFRSARWLPREGNDSGQGSSSSGVNRRSSSIP